MGGSRIESFTRDAACPTKWHYFLHQVGLLRAPTMTSRAGKELVAARACSLLCGGGWWAEFRENLLGDPLQACA
jgi:hypothetical protein